MGRLDPQIRAAPGPSEVSARRPWSLQARSLVASIIFLAAFLGITFLALDRAFYQSSVAQLEERLKAYALAFFAGSDLNVRGQLILPDAMPDARFIRPGSGLYAGVVGRDFYWESPSSMGRELPFELKLERGAERFVGPIDSNVGGVYVYSYGVSWADRRGEAQNYTFHIAEHEEALDAQRAVFQRTLGTRLLMMGVALLALQLLVLRWSLTPLRKVEQDLARVERGQSDHLPRHYPRELEGLTTSLNDFIESERERRERQRNVLGDLAHSLKTPLAVIRGEIESADSGATSVRQTIEGQVRRMEAIVEHQLTRAVTSGHQPFASAVDVERPAAEIVTSLEKLHAERNILCEFELDPQARFYGETGDLMEVLGNLLENAFKWARHSVWLTTRRVTGPGSRRPGLEIVVEDDGTGINADQIDQVLKRGVRGDERVPGHGIGLSIVQDIVRAHRGTLTVDRSAELGGARFRVRFEPH